ncbi:MAG: SMI1/KNR4 family protein, partial [Aquabacterium sp.]|nr:SMI1/KNR4 family protein [Aquabacterium sp.]
SRVIGTTEEALARAEAQLGRVLPSSFREWLRLNNGKGLESAEVFPVLDDRDPRKTWDSIVRQREVWRSYCDDVFPERVPHFKALLPFASFGTGDYYCFDYSVTGEGSEPIVVHWSHETGETSPRGESFNDFAVRLESGEFEHD